MKVNKIFHWLYFLMLLLPIFAIPIYALYMTNKNATFTQEITVSENKVVDFNQLVYNNTFDNTDYWISNGATLDVNNNKLEITAISRFGGALYNLNFLQNHKYYVRYGYEKSVADSTSFYLYIAFPTPYQLSTNNDLNGVVYDTFVSDGNYFLSLNFGNGLESNWQQNVLLSSLMLTDLTQMFGSGNEPTAQQFNEWYPNDYYRYTLSEKQLLKNYDQTTYTDTDVGSQFTYMLYNSVDKYFNYDNVFNFGTLYDYFQLNFFNGNAPIGFFIFWHYLIYFLLTSLLWLLFDVLMYVPNLIHRWIDKAEL